MPAPSTMNAISMNSLNTPRRESGAGVSTVSVIGVSIGVWIFIHLA